MIWRHSAKDALLVGASCLELGLKLVLLAGFAGWSWSALAGFFVVLTLLNFLNYECTGHFFIHTPFFRSRALNAAFGVLNSLAFGFPQTLYRAEHLNHHAYGSDRPDPVTGTTGDHSSVYRHGGADGGPEPVWRYALMMPLRQDALHLVRATPARLRGQLAAEVAAVLALLGYAAWVSLWALGFLIVLSFAGSALTHVENWLQHAHARPGSRTTDAVSSYGRVYNLVWFNNGYHQEHHYRPGVHWTAVRAVRAELPGEGERRVVPGSVWRNFKDRHFPLPPAGEGGSREAAEG